MVIKIKSILLNALMIISSLMIGCVVGEIIVRVTYGNDINLFPRYTTDVTYGKYTIRRIRPNEEYKHTSRDGVFNFKTNNRGFRNNYDIDYEKPNGTIRVISIGDSHTQGAEVNQEETFSYVAEEIIKNNGIRAEVINAGVAGFSNAEALVFLENEGIKYKPDYVVFGFYANDYADNIKANLFMVQDDSLVSNRNKMKHIPGIKIQNFLYKWHLFKFLGENSYLYAFAFNGVWNFYKRKLRDKSKARIATEYAIQTTGVTEYEKKLAGLLIKRLYEYCQLNNIRLITIDIPRDNPFRSSLEDLTSLAISNSDFICSAKSMVPEYEKLGQTHLPHEHHHISSESHALLGEKIANYVLSETSTEN